MRKNPATKRETEATMVRELRGNASLQQHPRFEGEKMKGIPARWSYRIIENYLNEKIPAGMPGETTFQSIWDWEHSVHPVTSECLQAWMMHYPPADPRHQLARDIFALRMRMHAHVIGAGLAEYETGDGKKLLKRARVSGDQS